MIPATCTPCRDGIIAAARDGAGTVGVAPEATVMPLVMPFDGAEAILTVPEMVRYAVDHGADIINGSIGAGPALPGIGPAENGVALAAGWREAFQYAIDRGVLVVMAAGNEWGPTCINELANIGEILCVGSLTRNGQVPLYSNYGVGLDLVAPGGGADPGAFGGSDVQNCLDGVLSAYSEEYSDQPNCADDIFGTPVPPYGFMTGTSQATPHVAGVAALLVGQGLTPLEAGERILATTDDLLVGGWDARTGHGALNAHRAVIDDRNPDSSIVTIG